MKYGLLVPMVLTFCLTGCGGGSSGGGTTVGPEPAPAPVPAPVPAAPKVEALRTSPEIGGPYYAPFQMIADSPDGSLYLAAPYALLQVNKGTGNVRTLAGYNQNIYLPNPVYLSGQYLYAGDNSGRIYGVFTGTDGFSGIDLLYNGHLPGAFNTGRIFGGGSTLYYMADDGVHTMPYGDYQNATLATPYPAATATIAVTQNEIFFSTNTMSVFRFDLRSKQMQLLRSGIQNQTGNGSESPVMAWHAPYLYWVDGTNLDRYNTTTAQVERVATGLPKYVYMLAADDATVYANATYGSDGQPAMLDKVDIASGQVSQITPSSQIQGIAAGNGTLFYVSGGDIFQVDGDAPPQRILSAAQYNVFWAQRDGGFAYDNGFLFMSNGERILAHELATNKTTVYFPTNRPDSFYYHDAALYVYTYIGGGALTRIPLDKPLRKVVEFSPSIATPGSVRSIVGDDTNLYWLYKGQYDGVYKVMRVAKSSPGAVEELFHSNSELRDVTVHGGKVYFSCLDSCGASGWVMASIAPDGGPVTAAVKLADDPESFHLNGKFYVADTADHQSRSLYLVDVERAAAKLLLRGLPFSSNSTNDVTVRASSKWLYVSSPWWKGIRRYPILSQGTLGGEEIIVGRPGDNVDSLMPATISTDGANAYFWNGGVKRVAE
jgi:hypothetical protein